MAGPLDGEQVRPAARLMPALRATLRPRRPVSGGPRSRLGTVRGYSTIELAVSLGMFLVLATMITLAIARSLGTSATVRNTRAGEAAVSDSLAQIAAMPYGQLLAGRFTVPHACEGSPAGGAGRTCVKVGATSYEIGYSYQVATTSGGSTCRSLKTPPQDLGYVGLCGRVEKINGRDVDDLLDVDNIAATRRVGAPSPHYKADHGLVRVDLTGRQGQFREALGAGAVVYLVKANAPSTVVSSSPVDAEGRADLTVPNPVPGGPTARTCTAQDPCMLALTPSLQGTSPAVLGDWALFGTTATPQAAIAVPADAVVDLSVAVDRLGSTRVELLAGSTAFSTPNAVPGSVCLWATFPDGDQTRTVPVCNDRNPRFATLDFYDPQWNTTAPGMRLPFPVATPIQLSVDHPDGTCYRAPKMLGSAPGRSAASVPAGTPADWRPAAVCTSYTWGVPSMPDTVTIKAGQADTVTALWKNGPGDKAAPAAGFNGVSQGSGWAKPRQAFACADDASCTTVADLDMEADECPGQYCFSGGNQAPVVQAPANGLVYTAAQTTDFTVTMADLENDSYAVMAGAGPTAGTLTIQGPGAPRAFPANGTVLTSGPGVATFQFRYVRPTATDSSLQTFQLRLTDSKGATRFETIGLHRGLSAWTVRGEDATVAQGSQTPLRFQVLDTTGSPRAGETLTISSPTVGLSATTAATDSDGYANFTALGNNTAAGTYTVTATTSTGRTGAATVTVEAAPGSLQVEATGTKQGSHGLITATALDRAGRAIGGVVVRAMVTNTDGATVSEVYPEFTGCATGTDGRCQIALVADANAPAGDYVVRLTSGTFFATTTVTVAATPTTVTSSEPLTIEQAGTNIPATVTVLDGAGNPMGDLTGIALQAPSGLTLSPTTASTDAAGLLRFTMTAAAGAPLGEANIALTVAGSTLTVPVTVTAVPTGYSVAGNTIGQGATGTYVVTLTSPTGAPVAGERVQLRADVRNLELASSAVTGTDGRALFAMTADNDTDSGTYPVQIIVVSRDRTYPATLTITQTLGSFVAEGTINQGAVNNTVQVVPYDVRGGFIAGRNVALTSTVSSLTVPATAVKGDVEGRSTFTIADRGPTKAGTYTFRATMDGLTRDVLITVRPTVASLTASPATTFVAGGKTRTAVITAKDLLGDGAAGVPVEQGTALVGVDTTADTQTDAFGRATLTTVAAAAAPAAVGTVSVRAGDVAIQHPISVLAPATATTYATGTRALFGFDDSNGVLTDVERRYTGSYTGPVSTPGAHVRSKALLLQSADSISVPDPGATMLPASDSFTLSTWVRPDDLSGRNVAVAVSKGRLVAGAATAGFSLGEASNGTSVKVELSDGPNHVQSWVTPQVGRRPVDWVGQWTHLALAVDRTSRIATLYVNGDAAGTVNISAVSGSLATTEPLEFGNVENWRFAGAVDDTAIHAGALTATQVAAIYSAGSAYTTAVMSDSPAAYWKFDTDTAAAGSVAADFSGNNLDGVYLSGVGANKAAVSPHLGASITNGSAGAVDLGERDELKLGKEFTLETWVKPTPGMTGYGGVIGNNGPNPCCGGRSPSLWTHASDQVHYNVTNGSTVKGGLSAAGTLIPGGWNHLVMTGDGTTVYVYVNGARIATMAQDGFASPTPVRWLGRVDSAHPGDLDEIAVYRTALPEASILNHYRAGVTYSDAVLADAPAGYWPMDEPTGAAKDHSGNTLDLNMTATMTGGKPGAGRTGYSRQAGATVGRFDGAAGSGGGATDALSIEGWVKLPAADPTYATQLLGRGPVGQAGSNYALYVFGNNNGANPANERRLVLYGSPGGTWQELTNWGVTVPADQWVHVAVTYAHPGHARVYLNGEEMVDARKATPGALPNRSDVAVFSTTRAGGLLDELAVYDKELTAAQVGAHYRSSFRYDDTVAASGPQLYYRYEDTDPRKATMGANANLVMGATGVDATVNDSSKALEFNGTDGRMNVPSAGTNWMQRGTEDTATWTAETWVTFTGGQTNGNRDYMIFGRSGCHTGLVYYPTTRQFQLQLSTSGVAPSNCFTGAARLGAVIDDSPGRTHHVVATYNKRALALWVDGVQVNSGNFGAQFLVNDTRDIMIGGVNGYNFKGILDETALYNRVLTDQEIRNHYLAGASYTDEVLNSSPELYLPLDEPEGATTFTDATGRGRTGTTLGTVAAGAAPVTATGRAVSLDGTGQVNLPDVDIAGSAVTVEAWVSPSVTTQGAKLVAKHSHGADVQGTLEYANGSVGFEITTGGAYRRVASGAILTAGRAYHVVGKYDGTTASLWVDGVKVATTPATGTIANNNFGWAVGALNASSTGGRFRGRIDNVAVYARALSDAEIRRHYTAGNR